MIERFLRVRDGLVKRLIRFTTGLSEKTIDAVWYHERAAGEARIGRIEEMARQLCEEQDGGDGKRL